MRLRVVPYRAGSRSAKALAESLGCLRIKQRNSRYRPRRNDVIINWGACSDAAASFLDSCALRGAYVLNHASEVYSASCKVTALTRLHEVGIQVPEFTTDYNTAVQWAEDSVVVSRTLTRANSGRGIVLSDEAGVPRAPLYTKYIKKTDEYRVHVFQGQVIDVQRKMRSRDTPDDQVNWRVRNHSNGFVFGREGVDLPDTAKNLATAAVAALYLDFGAVDVVYNQRSDQYYVLEVNSAPGLEGTTLLKYSEAVRGYCNERMLY